MVPLFSHNTNLCVFGSIIPLKHLDEVWNIHADADQQNQNQGCNQEGFGSYFVFEGKADNCPHFIH
ncbi:hypothetical protein D3C75_850060 [compost metagenome]